ncbi:hypothetical protein [Bosea sp. ANAM02]|uniref:hypothetical protein n=1 Tax=Bosea sp. ANAM02 TaxID=2020412 RepID=UPI00140F108C|nr:hypothetical protein [Bosea sp. ANAM02]BCB20285.1 hypothetical protein OCUBac02_31790 [Bosea sp. ANAM02]
MTAEHLKKLRAYLVDLDRAATVKLASKLGLRRHDLEDFADAGIELPAEAMAALESEFAQAELRRMMAGPRNGPLLLDLHENTGIGDARRDLFISGALDFTADELAKARDYMVGKPDRPAQPVTAMSAQPEPAFPLRGAALKIINSMSDSALAAFVRDHSPATDKAA